MLDSGAEKIDFGERVVDAEGGAGRCLAAERAERRLGAQMARADRYLFQIEIGGEIERVDPLDVEREDRPLIGRSSDKLDARDLAELLCGSFEELIFPRGDFFFAG